MNKPNIHASYSPDWKLWLKRAPGRALHAPGHLTGADPDETRLSEGAKGRKGARRAGARARSLAPSERRVSSGSAPAK